VRSEKWRRRVGAAAAALNGVNFSLEHWATVLVKESKSEPRSSAEDTILMLRFPYTHQANGVIPGMA
jgi:hypothetical protein